MFIKKLPLLYSVFCLAIVTGVSDKNASRPLLENDFQQHFLGNFMTKYILSQLEQYLQNFLDAVMKLFPSDENTTDTGDATSGNCTSDFIYFLSSLKKQWALKMLDSFGKPSSGILEGSITWTGSYDECLDVSAPPGPLSSGFIGQYCWLTFGIALKKNISIPLKIGICLPNSCNSNHIMNSYNKLALFIGKIPVVRKLVEAMPLSAITCGQETVAWSKSAIGWCILIAFLVSFVIFATLFDLLSRPEDIHVSGQWKEECNNTDIEIKVPLLETSTVAVRRKIKSLSDDDSKDLIATEKHSRSSYRDFLLCFSATKNGSALMSISTKSGELNCIHGIRFLSITWVILGHTFLTAMSNISHQVQIVKIVDKISFFAVLQALFAVDSFLLLSGFLLTYLFLKAPRSPQTFGEWLYFYGHRYIRLTPVYAIVLLFWMNVSHHLGSGPFSENYQGSPRKDCNGKWWANLLYVNNFVDSANMCMAWSWYLAIDMQLFIISPLLLVPLKRWPIIGISLMSATLLASWVVTYLLSYENNSIAYTKVPEGVEGLLDMFARTQRSANSFSVIYVKPYCRIGPFLVGMFVGYLLTKKDRITSIPKIIVALFWIIASACGLFLVYGLYYVKLGVFGTASYESLSRSAWALCLGWLIYACISGYGGPVNSLLSLKYFFPLSRLTYCVYLIHPLVVYWYFYTQKEILYPSLITGSVLYLAFLLITYGSAFLTSLVIEMPVIALEKQLRKTLM